MPSPLLRRALRLLNRRRQRHDVDPAPLLAQAREEEPGPVEIAYDGLSLELPVREER